MNNFFRWTEEFLALSKIKYVCLLFVSFGLIACSGESIKIQITYGSSDESSSSSSMPSNASSSSSGEVLSCNDDLVYGETALKLLTFYEYENSIRDLFAQSLPADLTGRIKSLKDIEIDGFANHKYASVDEFLLAQYFLIAERLASWAIENSEALPFDCSRQVASACAEEFIEHFAKFAFRRPLTDEEREDFFAILLETPSDVDGLQLAILTVLTSPQFLYREEQGISIETIQAQWAQGIRPFRLLEDGELAQNILQADTNAFVLGSFEFASVISFMLTGSHPDEELLAYAESGRLELVDILSSQADRLINSEKGQRHLDYFVDSWLETKDVLDLERLSKPQFTHQVKESLVQQVRERYRYMFNDAEVPYSEFLWSDYQFLDQTLSDYYREDSTSNSHLDFIKVSGIPNSGVMTSGAFNAVNAHGFSPSPVGLAVNLREKFLCEIEPLRSNTLIVDQIDKQIAQDLPLGPIPAEDVQDFVPRFDGFDISLENIFNPVFAVKGFDQVGQALEEYEMHDDANVYIDSMVDLAVEIIAQVNADKAHDAISVEPMFKMDQELYAFHINDVANAIARSEFSKQCFVEKLYRFSTGSALSPDYINRLDAVRSEELAAGYECEARELVENFIYTSNENPKALLKDILASNLLRFRKQ